LETIFQDFVKIVGVANAAVLLGKVKLIFVVECIPNTCVFHVENPRILLNDCAMTVIVLSRDAKIADLAKLDTVMIFTDVNLFSRVNRHAVLHTRHIQGACNLWCQALGDATSIRASIVKIPKNPNPSTVTTRSCIVINMVVGLVAKLILSKECIFANLAFVTCQMTVTIIRDAVSATCAILAAFSRIPSLIIAQNASVQAKTAIFGVKVPRSNCVAIVKRPKMPRKKKVKISSLCKRSKKPN
jgi:hypothetical protein